MAPETDTKTEGLVATDPTDPEIQGEQAEGKQAEAAADDAKTQAEALYKKDPAESGEGAGKDPDAPKAAEDKGDGEGDQKDEGAEAKDKPPEKYDLKLPEDSLLDEDFVERIAAQAKEQGLSQDDAQASLVEQDRVAEERRDVQAEAWLAETQADKEIGGENFKASVEHGKRFLDRYASDALKKDLDRWGFGNHPELVRMCARAGAAMAEDKIVLGDQSHAKKERSPADVLYGGGDSKEKQS